jgi:hypothetical protein
MIYKKIKLKPTKCAGLRIVFYEASFSLSLIVNRFGGFCHIR